MKYLIAILAVAALSGCSTTLNVSHPGGSLKNVKSIYVQQWADETSQLGLLITDDLGAMGYTAIYGEKMTPTVPVDVIVNYTTEYHWEFPPYPLDLNIRCWTRRRGLSLRRPRARGPRAFVIHRGSG
jgi:uncharacterized protein YceK